VCLDAVEIHGRLHYRHGCVVLRAVCIVGGRVGVSAWCRVGEYARATAVEVEMKVVIRNVHSQRLGGLEDVPGSHTC
jgi:hypothetical protein